MPLPVISNGYYWQIRGVLHSTQFAEITGCVLQDSTDAGAVGELVGGAFDDEVMPSLSQDFAHISTLVTPLDGTSASIDTPSESVGGDGNPAVPDNCASGVTLRTNFAGRSKRGRWYIPGTPVNQIDGDPSLWKTGWVSELQGDVDNFLGAIQTATADLAVLSRTDSVATVVTSLTVRRQIRTQRRRLTGGL
jgi:hypothetical protein